NTEMDYVSLFPIYDALSSNARIPGGQSLSGNTNRFVSAFMNTGYTFRKKYGFSISARKDAANVFGINSNDRWNPLWSVGSYWLISSEEWLDNAKVVNNLKIRLTYGHGGNSIARGNPHPLLLYSNFN